MNFYAGLYPMSVTLKQQYSTNQKKILEGYIFDYKI